MRVPSALLALFLLGQPVFAQALGGTVVDTASGKPVVGARVVVLDSAGKGLFVAVTSSDGKFSFHLPSAGEHRVRVSRMATHRGLPNPSTSAVPFRRMFWYDSPPRRFRLIP
jgi:hypothetical protein